MEDLTFIDLFAGAGGLSEGFIREGFKPIAHVEMDKAACYTLKTRIAYHHLMSIKKSSIYISYLRDEINRDKLYQEIPSSLLDSVINLPIGNDSNETIHDWIDKQLKHKNVKDNQVDLIIGGPPCQAYSLVGRARSKDGMESDPRNYLYIQYAKYLERYNPKMFVFENVIGLKSAKDVYSGELYLKQMENLFKEKGYDMKLFTIEATQFGVLQKRKRVIILGWKNKFPINVPNLETIRIENKYTVKEVLSDLPKIYSGGGINKFVEYGAETNEYLKVYGIRNSTNVLTQHIARPHTEQDKQIYQIAVDHWINGKGRIDYNQLPTHLKTHNNQDSFIDRFKVVAEDLPYSQTIVAHIAKDGHYYIHPDIKQNRSLTIREAARLQSFPDDYYFEGIKENSNRTAAFKQIGNAVPPLMAEKIANSIKIIFNGSTNN